MLEADATFDTEEARKIVEKETAAHEKRNWIRLTSFCNNRCTFCLDSAAHNGTYVPRLSIRSQIIDGRRKGATRLILSGGEPTIHPNYVEFITLGRQLGYRKIQTVTNGRLFSYPEFLGKCLDAGLSEITFSIHGHNAKVHDALVGVKGAFEEEVEGLKAAIADGRPVVNVDVCLNKGNVGHLPELLDRFMGYGVREFDLLHLIPFGRAFEEGRNSLFYDIDEAMDSIQHALRLSEEPDMHIWFNRFPPPYLEGFEHLIQDPYKLNDEVRGRFEEYELWFEYGQPLSCREPERCHRCYLERLCDTLEEKIDTKKTDAFEVYRVHATSADTELPGSPGTFDATWICAPDLATAAALVPRLPDGGVILDLERYDDLDAHLEAGVFAGRDLVRAYAARPEDVDALLAADGTFEVVAWLNQTTAAHLVERYATTPDRLVVSGRSYERLTEAATLDADLPAFFAAFDPKVPVEDVPACISGRPPRARPNVLDATMLNDAGRLEIYGYARRYILDHYYTKSHRCRGCVHFDRCDGAHINWVRAHGYKTLVPVAAQPAKVAVS